MTAALYAVPAMQFRAQGFNSTRPRMHCSSWRWMRCSKRKNECKCADVSIAGLYLSSEVHADDIRSLSQTRSATESQAATLVNFTTNNGLQINASKTEVVALSTTNQTPNLTFSVAGHQVGTKQKAKCLGYWWKSNLGSAKSVEANIEKVMKAFFAAVLLVPIREL